METDTEMMQTLESVNNDITAIVITVFYVQKVKLRHGRYKLKRLKLNF